MNERWCVHVFFLRAREKCWRELSIYDNIQKLIFIMCTGPHIASHQQEQHLCSPPQVLNTIYNQNININNAQHDTQIEFNYLEILLFWQQIAVTIHISCTVAQQQTAAPAAATLSTQCEHTLSLPEHHPQNAQQPTTTIHFLSLYSSLRSLLAGISTVSTYEHIVAIRT